MTSYQHLGFLSAAHFFHHYMLAVIPVAVLSVQSDWLLSDSDAVALGTVMYLMLGIATTLFGYLGDRISKTKLMSFGLIGTGIAAILAGISADSVSLLLSLGLLGFVSGVYHPVGLVMVADNTERVGFAYAINGVFGNLGSGLAAVVTALVIGLSHWRLAFVIPGMLLFIIGIIYCFKFVLNSVVQNKTLSTVSFVSSFAKLSKVLIFLILFLVVASVYEGLVAGAVTYTLPRLIQSRVVSDSSLLLIGGSTSTVLTIGSIAQLGSGYLLDRCAAKNILIVLFLGQSILLLIATMVTGMLLMAVLILFYGFLYAWYPITSWLINHYVATDARARVLSYEYIVSLGFTALTVSVMPGLYRIGMTERSNLWIVFVMAIGVLVSTLYLPDDEHE